MPKLAYAVNQIRRAMISGGRTPGAEYLDSRVWEKRIMNAKDLRLVAETQVLLPSAADQIGWVGSDGGVGGSSRPRKASVKALLARSNASPTLEIPELALPE